MPSRRIFPPSTEPSRSQKTEKGILAKKMKILFGALLVFALLLATCLIEPTMAQDSLNCGGKCKGRCSKAGVSDRAHFLHLHLHLLPLVGGEGKSRVGYTQSNAQLLLKLFTPFLRLFDLTCSTIRVINMVNVALH
ncbi:hypothetical protein ACET3Z_001290 [Daucus carota]